MIPQVNSNTTHGEPSVSEFTPNPGSDEAREQGCRCPVLDNARGYGYMGGARDENGDTMFVIDERCPLHASQLWRPLEHVRAAIKLVQDMDCTVAVCGMDGIRCPRCELADRLARVEADLAEIDLRHQVNAT